MFWNGAIANSAGLEKNYDPFLDTAFSLGVGLLTRAPRALSQAVEDGFARVSKSDFDPSAGVTRKEYDLITSPLESQRETGKAMMYQRLSSGDTKTELLTDSASIDQKVLKDVYGQLNESLARMRLGDDTPLDRAYRYLDSTRTEWASEAQKADRAETIVSLAK